MSPIKHKLGSPWPHPVVCAVANDWLANNRFASAALGTVMWTLLGAYHDADWGKTDPTIVGIDECGAIDEHWVDALAYAMPRRVGMSTESTLQVMRTVGIDWGSTEKREPERFVTSMGDGTENEP